MKAPALSGENAALQTNCSELLLAQKPLSSPLESPVCAQDPGLQLAVHT